MLRALYAGVSGMNANITEIDVIGNNIANANTIGFKAGRVTFNEMMTQNIRSASRPVSGGLGGTNPQQIGLGTLVGGIDTNFNQGNFQTTGMKTDLAIQGNGFFILNDGSMNHYSRAGTFGLDAANTLVNPTTGLRVQGVMADDAGVVTNGALTDLIIDPALVVPAEASTEVQLMGNMDADSDATESILSSTPMLAMVDGADLLTSLHGGDGGEFGIRNGDLISATVDINGTSISPAPFVVGSTDPLTGGDTLQSLVNWLNSNYNAAGLDFALGADGELTVDNTSGFDAIGMAINCPTAPNFNSNVRFAPVLADGDSSSSNEDSAGTAIGELRAPATGTDTLAAIYGSDGGLLGLDLSSGSTNLQIQGARGGTAITALTMNVTAATTLSELLTQLQSAFRTTETPTINADGELVINGDVGLDNSIGDVSLTELTSGGSIALTDSFNFTQIQSARDAQDFSVATTVYDSLGGTHTVSYNFQKISGENDWIWTAELEGEEELISGGSGRVSFSEDGMITNFSFDEGASSLQFRPQATGDEGAAIVSLTVDYGDIGTFNGLTQFVGNASLQSMADGFAAGELIDYEIDQGGYVIGLFSNDTVRNLARISVAQFANESGLLREANNTYRLSGNSGQANAVFAGDAADVVLMPGTLETSNVDLASEFTRLVVAQRAFQANARVITTGDQVMQELVSLVR